MFQKYLYILVILWTILSEFAVVQSSGNRKLDLPFENVHYMDILSRAAMRSMHDDLDTDEDGNVSEKEGKDVLKLLENSQGNSNLPGFATDVDGRITEQEFWNSWISSDVHNWTNAEMLAWLKYDVELPQYTSTFHSLNISGAAFPILACNGSIASALVEGSKENKIKLMLKAKEIVLFGPSKEKANFLKDALLTISLLLALSGIFFGVHVQRNANRTIESIQREMALLQSSMDTLEAEGEMDRIWARTLPRQDDEHSRGSNSAESEDSMTSLLLSDDNTMASNKLAEVMRELDSTKEALRNAEKQLQRKAYELPKELLDCIHSTYQVESKLFEMKKKKVYKDVEQTKSQFQKIERNRSTFFGILQVVHSRQMDSFDFQVQQTRDEFRELQSIIKERRKRWATIEKLCDIRIKSNSRSSLTPSRTKLTPEEEFMSTFDSLSLTSSASGNVERNSSLTQKSKSRSKRPSITSSSLNEEDRDTISLQSFSSHPRKSPISSRKQGNLPNHCSFPTLSHTNSYEKERGSARLIAHSESATHLPSQLIIPEDRSQTFPKRSPVNKRRSKLPESMQLNGVHTPNTPLEVSSKLPTSNGTSTHQKSKSVAPPAVVTVTAGLNATKRSPSIQSLPTQRKKDSLDVPDSPSNSLQDVPVKNNGVVEALVIEDLKSSPNEEKARKRNLFKRKFFKNKTKDKK